ncbi:MAG: rod shape-determining protein RodA [Rikenellaceae bacterium]
MIVGNSSQSVRNRIDWLTILIYITLVILGWVSIYAAVWDDQGRSMFDLTQNYGRQAMWIGVSWFTALVITLSSSKYWHMFSYPFYGLMIVVMLGVFVFGHEVNGAKSWLDLGGGIRLQPVEFMKIATALALGRFMSSYNFDLYSRKSLYYIGLIIFIPILLILAQNDTGSALVFCAFFIMLYREGLGKELYIIVGVLIVLFLISFFLEPLALTIILFIGIFGLYLIRTGNITMVARMVGAIGIISMVSSAMNFYWNWEFSNYEILIFSIIMTVPLLLRWSIQTNDHSIWLYLALFIGAVIFTKFVDYAFENILQYHQQKRILDMLGIESDPKRWSYNVIQSKIAIGSGGFWGKGFLQGTQTKFSFVPEQSTDFIFCTVGEEHGFLGTLVVVTLFGLLIYRIMRMGERQVEPFARVYCYSVAGILFLHFFINIAMTIGLFPVVGIPLPFFSYGGSSLLAFTILVFIAIRLDSVQVETQ